MTPSDGKYQPNKIRKPSWIQRFFILCSGADKDILYQCSTEWNKYAGIGGTIFFTGLLASLSGGYALYTIFRGDTTAFLYAILFGITWGFVIFNLDRFIVSSIKKEGNIQKEILQATPRFILAIIISIVIAKPLEVRIFESRIEQQILEDKIQKLVDEKLSLDKLNNLTTLKNTIESQNNELGILDSLRQGDPTNDDFKKLLNERNVALQELNNVSKVNNPKISDYNSKINQVKLDPNNYKEIKDSLGNIIDRKLISEANKSIRDLSASRNVLLNEIKIKQKRVEDADAEIQKSRNDYKALMAQRVNEKQAEIGQTRTNKAKADSLFNTQFDESLKIKERSYNNNFITQLEALGNLTSSNTTMALTSLMIMLLFIVMETAPILVKLLSKRGPYDDILDRVEYEHYINEKELISRWNTKINELLDKAREAAKLEGDTFIQVEKQRLDHELRTNQNILADLAQKQENLAKIAIEKWYQEEIIKANSNHSINIQRVKPKIEDSFWRQVGASDKIEYFFRNGSLSNNELLYLENEQLTKGKWQFISLNKNEISIELPNIKVDYLITELSEKTLKLKEKGTPEIIELERI